MSDALKRKRGKPITETYKGHQIFIQWDLDWHLKIDGHRRGTFMTLDAADAWAKKLIEELEKGKQ